MLYHCVIFWKMCLAEWWIWMQMIRYPHYAFTCLGTCPYWLTYLRYYYMVLYLVFSSETFLELNRRDCLPSRYTGFIMIYPTGLMGECECFKVHICITDFFFHFSLLMLTMFVQCWSCTKRFHLSKKGIFMLISSLFSPSLTTISFG